MIIKEAVLFGLILAAILIPLLICFPDRGLWDVEERGVKKLQFLRVSRDPRRYVRPEEQTALLSPPPCAPRPRGHSAPPPPPPPPFPPPPRMLMLVTSAPAHYERRQAIRETWGGRSEDARLVFVLGRGREPATQPPAEVFEESQRHGDLLVEDFTDAYHNLTLKTLFLLKWAVRECPSAAFVLKTDDDMLINTRGLVRALPRWVAQARGGGANGRQVALKDAAAGDPLAPEAPPPLIFGYVYHRSPPFRD
ncbi:Hexosyltransferase, partial [Gryllus bimaculatus]